MVTAWLKAVVPTESPPQPDISVAASATRDAASKQQREHEEEREDAESIRSSIIISHRR